MAIGTALRICAADAATCLQFFSRLPVPSSGLEPRPFGRAIAMLPLASLLIGACVALPVALGAVLGLPHPMAALLGIGCGLLATGGLHEDGLADTADGFGGGASRHRKLEIMRDSRIGTYGVAAIAMTLLWRVAALSALLDRLPGFGALLPLLAVAAVSRAFALLPLAALPPARADGLGHGVGALDRGALVTCFGLAALFGIVLPILAGTDLDHAALACLLAAVASAAVTGLAKRQIGGHTGDVAGASQQAAEAAYLLGLLVLPGAG